MAQDERSTIRFGLIYLDSTNDTDISGETTELQGAGGIEFDYEFYITKRFGVEASIATAADADTEADGDTVAALTVTPLTVGLNGHIVKTQKVDWAVGILGGRIFYGDFESTDNVSTAKTSDETTYGVQTFVDIGLAMQGRWGINFGVKWLKADVEVTPSIPGPKVTLEFDPAIVRAMGYFRW